MIVLSMPTQRKLWLLKSGLRVQRKVRRLSEVVLDDYQLGYNQAIEEMTEVLHKLFSTYPNGDIVFRFVEDTSVQKILGCFYDPKLLEIFLKTWNNHGSEEKTNG